MDAIKLVNNDFLNKGVCKYEDIYGNKYTMRRTEEGFSAKLRFNNCLIKTKPIYVSIPTKENEDGAMLHYDYPHGTDIEAEDVKAGIKGLTELTQHWIYLIKDINFATSNLAIMTLAYPDTNLEYWKRESVKNLAKYKELEDGITEIFQLDADNP